MSHNFLKKLLGYMNSIFKNKVTRDVAIGEIALRFSVTSAVLAVHGIYAFSTEKNDAIIVTKKYKMNRSGYTDFMIVDNKGRHFNVNNSLWYWKWDSIEDWHSIDEKSEEKLLIRYYGWRVPALGLFPNIVLSDRAKFLHSMSSSEFCRIQTEKWF